jgi:hypothetical protein
MHETSAQRVASGIVFRGGFRMPARNTPQKTLESWKQISGGSTLVRQVSRSQSPSFRRIHPAQVEWRVEDHA